jgi:hypothetical protein
MAYEEKMHLGINIELDIFVETILESCEFLAACQKSDIDVKGEIKAQIIKLFKITDSEVSFTTEQMTKMLQDMNSDYITKTILQLTDKGFIDMGVGKDGEMTVEATKQAKEYMEFCKKHLDKNE